MPNSITRLKISSVLPGMILGSSVIAESGALILNEGAVLTHSMIARLMTLGFVHLDILDLVEEPNPTFEKNYHRVMQKLYKAFQKIRLFKQIPLEELIELTEQTLDMVLKSAGVLVRLIMIDRKHKYTFVHSVNVGVIAGIIGKWLGYADNRLQEIILAGFLHDIGKTQIPLRLLNKQQKLSAHEFQIIQTHSMLGYYLVQQDKSVPRPAVFGVLQHHERLDGSGYPQHLATDQISEIAKIIAIADIYDAMTSNRSYRKAVTPFEVIDVLSSEMFSGKLDPAICTLFLTYLQESLVGVDVKLDNGQMGKVVYLDRTPGSKPIIQTDEGEFIDLADEQKLRVSTVTTT